MNGIERITQRIDAENQAEVDRILNEGRAAAARVTARFQNEAAAETAAHQAKNEQAARERRERLISSAQMEARKSNLAARQEIISEVYDMALERLCSLPDEAYSTILAYLLAHAAYNGSGEVIFSEKDKNGIGSAVVAKVNDQIGSRLTVADETREMCGGFILRSGQVELNCDFDTLMRLQKQDTAAEVAQRLFD